MKFFSYDSKFSQIMLKLCYGCYLNLLWFVCSLPVFTIGASTAALYDVTLQIAREEDPPLTSRFFHAFRENFRQATTLWLILLMLGIMLGADGYILYHLYKGTTGIVSVICTLGLALIIVAAITLCKINAVGPFGILGTARGLEGGLLVAGVAANFVLGILMTAGIGLYAPCMAVVLLLGMSADVAFPVMMGSCAYLCPACGITFIKEGKYNRAATIPMIISGSIGVLIAGFIVTSLPLTILTYLVCVVMVICAVMFFHDARKQTK